MERVLIPTSEICHVCGAPMVLKFGRTGQFLGCSKYPDCKATRPLGGQPRAEAVASEHACPKCGKPLLIRENKRGEKFLSCSGYPDCKESFNIDEQGNPVPSRVETEHVCEKCGKPMALRQGRRGPFLGCTGYPKCRNVLPVDSDGKPVQTVKIDVSARSAASRWPCARAGAGRSSAALVTPSAAARRRSPRSSRNSLPSLPPHRRRPPGPDMKAIEVGETCDDCGSSMVVRRGRRGYFLGCSKYPKCKGTKEPSEATQKKSPP